MPFVARLDRTVRIDATVVDTPTWAAIHRVRPRRDLRCPECDHPMNAKVRDGLRFFAHDPGAPQCSAALESADHRMLKRLLADAVRDVGWTALLEEPVGAGRRADVVAVSPDGTSRVAFEVQLSSQSAGDTVARTRDYAGVGVSLVWVVRHADRLGVGHREPWLRLDRKDQVTSPLAELDHDPSKLKAAQKPVGLPRAVAWVLHGRLVWYREKRAWITPEQLRVHVAAVRTLPQPPAPPPPRKKRPDLVRACEDVIDALPARRALASVADPRTDSRVIHVTGGRRVVATSDPARLGQDQTRGAVVLLVEATTDLPAGAEPAAVVTDPADAARAALQR